MDKAKQYRIDEWIEGNIYGMFEQCMQRGVYPNAEQAAVIAPLIQMYLAIQTRELAEEMGNMWKLLADGQAGIWISGNVDVDIVRVPKTEDKSKG